MITIDDILSPRRVLLDLTATTQGSAIHEIAGLLKGDERVVDWNGFVASLKNGGSCVSNENGYGLCIPHARTNCVTAMVMAAGRSRDGILFDTVEGPMRIHYIFVIGVPLAMASDYLRIIGALARMFRSPQNEAELRRARNPQEFIAMLAASEMPV